MISLRSSREARSTSSLGAFAGRDASSRSRPRPLMSDRAPPPSDDDALKDVVDTHGLDELATSWLRRSGASVNLALRAAGFGARGPLRRLLSAAGRAEELRVADAK